MEADLGALVEEGVPDPQQQVAGEALHEAHQEPVEGDEGHVHGVLLEVGRQPGQLLCHEVLQHPLVRLQSITSNRVQRMLSRRKTAVRRAERGRQPGKGREMV